MFETDLTKLSVFEPLIIPELPQVQQLIDDLKQEKRNFKDSDFAGLDLSGLDFSHADLRNCNFFNCELRCVDFTRADLRGVNFKGANLRTANLTEADLTGANLIDVDLGHVSLVGTTLEKAKVVRCQCHKTIFKNTTLPGGEICFRMKVAGNIGSDHLLKHHLKSLKDWQNIGILLFSLGNFMVFNLVDYLLSYLFF